MRMDILYHVRGGAPAKGVRSLRFRNTFQGFSCLIASANKHHAIRDWFSRYIACTYPFIRELKWNDQGQLVGVLINGMSNEPLWHSNKESIFGIKVYVYKYILDQKWNRHPFKDCYMTRGNVRYKSDVEYLELNSLLNNENLTIEYTE